MGRLLPADTALEFSVEYASVIAFGQARIVEDEQEARRGLQGMLDKYFPGLKPGVHYRPIVESELKQTAVYAIDIESMSGKRKAAAP
jgi:nitroimidazol reductase NimA-like FMN-containing flavoprotein (pyridoxamine 5'-phosphate oxidase superfamily)